MLLVLTSSFLLLLVAGMPISFSLGISALIYLYVEGLPLILVARKMYGGLDAFVLLAVPFFILAADIMNASGISAALIRCADLLVGRIRGGLAHVNVLASMFFAGISGAALADAAGLGSIEISMMEKAGYDKPFSAAVTAASAIIGPIIPPSIIMIIYAVSAGNVSIIGMFLAGVVPGILIGLVLMMIIYVFSLKRDYPRRETRFSLIEALSIVKDSVFGLMMPLIILGGILFGVFTPTEAAAIAAFYALIVGMVITGTLALRDVPPILLRSFVTTSIVFLIVATAQVWAYVLTISRAADVAADIITSFSGSPIFFLLLANIFFLALGCVMEPAAAIIISVPIFAPLAMKYGIDPLHFGIIVTVNLAIGCITPPVGTSLYAVAAVANVPVERVVRSLIPFYVGEIAALLVITYIPSITLGLPTLFGIR